MTVLAPFALFPDLGAASETLYRISYGLILIATLSSTLPHWRRFFLTEKFRGYAQDSPFTTPLQRPTVMPLILLLWFAAALGLVFSRFTLAAALVNLLLCRYFFVSMRWRGVLRGFGAPGFMTYWGGAALFLLIASDIFDPSLRGLALLVIQCDFAFIMLSAGIYKLTAGYANNHGMEGGMSNPQWGYWWRFYTRLPPFNPVFWIMNQLAWSTEVVAGILMLIPSTRFIGAMLILLSFIFIATQIRLGFLCELVIACCFLFFHSGSPGEALAKNLVHPAVLPVSPSLPIGWFLRTFLVAYLILLPIAHAGLFLNFYGRKRFPGPLQTALEKYTNFFGIIIWRVFSVDHVNFFIRIYRQRKADGARELISDWGKPLQLRFNHVGESITVTTLFTTLKYFASNRALFVERILRYARTLPCGSDSLLIFQYVSIQKGDCFNFVPVVEYVVDPGTGEVTEKALSETFSVHAAHQHSPVHEGVRPGTYLPAGNH